MTAIPVDQALGQLADYLTNTLMDESQKETHDASCHILIYGSVGEACTCDATSEWRATIASIMAAVDALRYTEDPLHALLVMQALAKPYEKGSAKP